MTKQNEMSAQDRTVPSEQEFSTRWTERLRFAKHAWEWWPDRTRLSEFVEFMRLLFEF